MVQLSIISILFYISFSLDLIFGIDNALNSVLFIYLGYLYYSKLQNEKGLYILIFVFFWNNHFIRNPFIKYVIEKL